MTRSGAALITTSGLLIQVAGTTWPFVVAVLAPVLIAELGLSATVLGVAYAAYYLTCSAWSAVAGRIVDRGGWRVSALVLLAVALVQNLLLAAARGPVLLLLSGMIGGLALALANPITNMLISTLLSGRAARTAIGIKQTGVPVSIAFSGTVTPLAASAFGWRGGVIATLTIGLTALVLVMAVRGPGGGEPIGTRAAAARRRFGLERFVLGMGAISSALSGYLVLYVVATFDGSIRRAGTLVTVFAVSSAVGRLVWTQVGGGARTLPLLRMLGVVGAVGLSVLTLATVEWGVWLAAIMLGLTVHSWQGLGMLAVIEADRSGSIGSTSARVMRDFYLGFVIGAPLAGALIDRVGFRAAWAGLIGVALLATASLRGADRTAVT